MRIDVLKSPELLATQNALFRKHATGNFATLLRAVARDPAMLVYLDTNLNRAAAPNENFARELLELFTLGEGRGYTEMWEVFAFAGLWEDGDSRTGNGCTPAPSSPRGRTPRGER